MSVAMGHGSTSETWRRDLLWSGLGPHSVRRSCWLKPAASAHNHKERRLSFQLVVTVDSAKLSHALWDARASVSPPHLLIAVAHGMLQRPFAFPRRNKAFSSPMIGEHVGVECQERDRFKRNLFFPP